jgi:hypothetical protein
VRYRLVGFIVWCTAVFALSLAAGQGNSPLAPAAERPAFGTIAPLIDQLRHGTYSKLVVHIGTNGFEVLREVTTPITSIEARAARTELRKSKSGLPLIRFTKSHEIAVYDLDDRTVIEYEIDVTPEKWTRRRLEEVATYPDSAWGRFMEFCLQNGLTELTVYEQGTARFGELTFAAVGPAGISYPRGMLHLSPAFYEDMRVSPDYPESAGTNGFVALIHDPRQDAGERFRLMSGLAALFAANPKLNFEYLVEGAFPEKPSGSDPNAQVSLQERAIRDGGLEDYLRRFSEPQRKLIINSMLRRFLLDSPLAFQLSRSPEAPIHGLAIGGTRFLGESSALFVEPSKIQAALTALAEFAATRDQENINSDEAAARGMILEGAYMTAALYRADSTDLNDTQRIKHLERMKASFGALGDVASEISKSLPEMQIHADALKTQSAAYSTEAQQYRNALKRNESMLALIEEAGRNSSKEVPLVFIGSYHTEAITRRLRADGIGYVVIEPRRRAPYNHFDRDQKRVEDVLHTPDALLTEEQVRTDHIPFINTILSEAKNNQAGITSVTDMGNINLNRLQLVVASNGWLVDSVVEIGKASAGGVPPPEMPRGAFAFFDEADGKPRLMLLDKASERWRAEDRYARIADAMFALPYADKDRTPVIHFVRHPTGKSSSREYYSIYKPDSKRVYLLEGSISSVAAVLKLPTVRRRGSVDVNVQLGELLIRGGGGRALAHVRGNLTRNADPRPITLSASSRAWCRSAIHCAIESPSPAPPASRLRDSSTR